MLQFNCKTVQANKKSNLNMRKEGVKKVNYYLYNLLVNQDQDQFDIHRRTAYAFYRRVLVFCRIIRNISDATCLCAGANVQIIFVPEIKHNL